MLLIENDAGLSDILHFFQSPVLDFGKIIIYTSNLRIIKAPQKKPEMFRQHTVPLIDLEGYPKAKERGSRRRAKAVFTQEEAEKEEKQICDTDTKVMILGQIILSGVVRFYHPISVSCFSHSRHVLLPIPLSLHVSSAIFSSLYLCFQENNCRIFFCFCLTPKSPLCFLVNANLFVSLFAFFSTVLLQQPPTYCPSVIWQLWTNTDESTVLLCPCSICLLLTSQQGYPGRYYSLPLTSLDDYCSLLCYPSIIFSALLLFSHFLRLHTSSFSACFLFYISSSHSCLFRSLLHHL